MAGSVSEEDIQILALAMYQIEPWYPEDKYAMIIGHFPARSLRV